MSLVSGEDLLLADQGSQDHMPPLFLNACMTAMTACMTAYLTACSGRNLSRFCLKKAGVWMPMS